MSFNKWATSTNEERDDDDSKAWINNQIMACQYYIFKKKR